MCPRRPQVSIYTVSDRTLLSSSSGWQRWGHGPKLPPQQKRHWHLIFGASLNVSRPSPAGGCAGIGRGARPRRLPAGESTRHPLHRGMATASSTGLGPGAGLHPSCSPPSPGHPWLLPREGRAELCGGGNASDPREDRRGGDTGKAGKEALQPLPAWWWLLLCSRRTAPLQVTAPRLARTQGTYGRGGLQLWAGRAGLVSHRGRLKKTKRNKK